MSPIFLARVARPAARGVFAAGNKTAVMGRGFQLSTTSRVGVKESAQDTDYEKHKQDSIQKQKQGKGHWKPELSSDSEEAVKADRHATGNTAELQEKTKKTAEETAKKGTSMRDGL